MLPHLQSLVLTGVPLYAPSTEIPRNIIAFIRACSEESYWSKLQSKVAYALPPGKDRLSAEKAYATSLFALKTIVLEMTYATEPVSEGKGMSSVEDRDCEVFWSAAAGDFTFFGSGDEECGQPDVDPSHRIPLEARMGKMVIEEKPELPPRPAGNAKIDVLAEISKFRKEKKRAYEVAVARGDTHPYIEGYWDGGIQVIKPDR